MVPLLVAFVLSLAWCLVAISVGPNLGFVDDPAKDPELKVHHTPALPLGGVGLFLAIHAALLLTGAFDGYFLVASLVVLALGVVDDRFGLPPLVRLAVELGAALILIVGSNRGEGALFDLAAVVLIVVAINAVNLFDGLDGLAGSVGVVSAVGLGLVAGAAGDLALFLAFALLGFLLVNWHPARVFLGDSGAYFTGMTLAYLVVRSSAHVGELLVLSGMLGLFMVDLFVTVIRRSRAGRPLFSGDRSHVYDRLRDLGLAVPVIVILAVVAQVAIVAVVSALHASTIG